MNKSLIVFGLCLVSAIAGEVFGPLGAAQSEFQQLPDVVSLLQLIAMPTQFDAKQVMVIGFLRVENEGDILYLHREDYEHHIYKNGIWVTLDARSRQKALAFNSTYVAIKGTFDASHKGHMSLTSGSLVKITDIISWPQRGRSASN